MEKDNDKYDIGRYNSANDRDRQSSEEKNKKLREAYRRKHPEQSCYYGAFESLPANDLPDVESKTKRKHSLLGDLWRPGEVSVLFGETSVGKSIFAVQIAESIASGYGVAPFTRPRRCRVAYVDIENSAAQFRDRYSCASKGTGREPIRHHFPLRLERAGFAEFTAVPEVFNGDIPRYLRHSIKLLFQQSQADIFVIDSLSGLERSTQGGRETHRWMRFFRSLAADGYSILVVARSKPRRRHINSDTGRPSPAFAPLTLKDIPRPIAEIADSVFAIGTSTTGPDVRYIKHLSSHSARIYHDSEKVLTYRIERSHGEQSSKSKKSADKEIATNIVHPADAIHPLLNPQHLPMPYIGLTLVGMHKESDHLRDYPAETRYVEHLEYRRQHPNRRPNPIIDMFLSKDYNTYLLGP